MALCEISHIISSYKSVLSQAESEKGSYHKFNRVFNFFADEFGIFVRSQRARVSVWLRLVRVSNYRRQATCCFRWSMIVRRAIPVNFFLTKYLFKLLLQASGWCRLTIPECFIQNFQIFWMVSYVATYIYDLLKICCFIKKK